MHDLGPNHRTGVRDRIVAQRAALATIQGATQARIQEYGMRLQQGGGAACSQAMRGLGRTQQGGGGGPAFMSTHPSSGDRIAALQTAVPRVMPLYEAARAKR